MGATPDAGTSGAVGIYLRISKDPLKLAAGVTRQRTDCLKIAAERWPNLAVTEFIDNDISASRYSKKLRVEYNEMVAGIESGTIAAVVAWDLDRLLRKPKDLEHLIETCDRAQMRHVVTAQSDLDLTTDDGMFRARIMAAVAAKESDDKSRRIRRVNQDRRERGLHHGGRVVYGYQLVDRVPHVDVDAAQLVQEAARRVLDGESLRSIARWLDTVHANLGTRKGGQGGNPPRTGDAVRRVLSSPTLVARTSSGVRGEWQPIITDEQHANLLALFRDPARLRNAPSGGRVHWPTGLLWCGRCGGRLQSSGGYDGRGPVFSCAGCGGLSISLRQTVTHLELALFEVVDAYREAPAVTPIPSLDETRLSELATMYATGQITRGEWQAARDALQPQVDMTPRNPSHVPIDLAAEWDHLTALQQHAYASRVIDRVTIMPWRQGYGRWQPDRIRIDWRDTPDS